MTSGQHDRRAKLGRRSPGDRDELSELVLPRLAVRMNHEHRVIDNFIRER
jgi:hypothetical protein